MPDEMAVHMVTLQGGVMLTTAFKRVTIFTDGCPGETRAPESLLHAVQNPSRVAKMAR